jgi:hypothetical protein
MAGLSLIEAAAQAATSKVDIWRAIQQGALPAEKTSDGGYAIDPTDLFRIFERQTPEPAPPEPAPDKPPAAKTAEAPEPPVADDLAAAFAALQAELKNMLGASAADGPPAGKDRPGKTVEMPTAEGSAQQARPVALEAGQTVADEASPADALPTPAATHRPWWRRLAR